MAESDPLKLLVILGSTREGRFGETVGKWFVRNAATHRAFETELVDLRDFPLPFYNISGSPAFGDLPKEAHAWAAKIQAADAFVIVTPEYNHGYTAVLKNALDALWEQWNNKPVTFVSYGGAAGGSRAVEQLRQVAIELEMAPVRRQILIPSARRSFDEHGEPHESRLTEQIDPLLDQLAWWGRALRAARTAA